MSVIGFDIGNENCVIAAAKRGGIDVLLNDEAKRESPGVVSFGDKQRFMGSAGAAVATANPKSTISQIKRLIGRQYNEPSVQEELKLLPFVTSEGPRGGIMIELEYMKEKLMFTPVEILGMLFKHLKQIAEKNLESPVADCVIGIPSYFTDLQRREYLDAAAIAGLKPLRLMHDGTAIAFGYGMYKTDLSDVGPTIVVFVDIGHCDTQVTVAAFIQGQMKILAHCFDSNLGGRDFDEVIFKHFAAQFKEKYEIDVSSNARTSIRLRASCEKVKKVLSANTEAPLSIECLIEDKDVRGIITRVEFENLSRELLERVAEPCFKAVNESGISHDKIYTIELVGSGSRIPAILKRLTSLFQKEPTRTLNASECVARGCALRCAMLSPTLKVQDYKVQDIFPYSIGLPADKTKLHKDITLFAKGSPYPDYYILTYDGMTPLDIHVFYANDKNFPAGMSTKVGHFVIDSSQSSGKEKVRFDFLVLLNKNGVVEIDSASILEDNNRSRKNNNPHPKKMVANSHMSNLAFSENLDVATTKDELRNAQEIEKMLTEQDIKVEQTKDQRNTLESFVYDTRSKLSSAYRSFATDAEKDGITKSLQETEDWLYEDSDDESDEHNYSGKLEELKQLLDPIEKRYKDENERLKATKALLVCIEGYRSATDLLAPRLKHEVNIQCLEAEQWLNRYQQEESSKNIDPIQWSSVMKQAIERFESNVKDIMRPKPSPQKLHQHLDSYQRDNHGDSDQRDNRGDSDQRDTRGDSDRRDGAMNFNRKDGPVDSNLRDGSMNSNPNAGLSLRDIIKKMGGLLGLIQKDQNNRGDSDQRDNRGDSDQRDTRGDSDRRDGAMNFNRKDGPVDSNLRDGSMNSNPNAGLSLRDIIKKMGGLLGLIQKDQSLGLNQSCQTMGLNQRDHQTVGLNQRDQTICSNQKNQTVGVNQRDRTMCSNQGDQTVGVNQSDRTMCSNQGDQTVGVNQSDRTKGDQTVSVGVNQSDRTMCSNQGDQTVGVNQSDRTMCSNQGNQTVGVSQRDQTMDSKRREHPVDLNQKGQSLNSDKRDQSVNSNDTDQSANPDIKEQQPMSSDPTDQPKDLGQKNHQDHVQD